MGCLLALLALITPRLVILILAIFSTYLHSAYQTVLWPVLGFFFMPLTTLAYAFAMNQAGSLSGIYLVLFVIAVLIDLGSAERGGTTVRRRDSRRR